MKENIKGNKGISILTRAIISAVFFIAGFNFSYSAFFKENPLYGIPFLAETLISLTSAAAGFYLIPSFVLGLRGWIEDLIKNTVSEIVGNFWEQQTKRINDKKRNKHRQKAEEEKQKLKSQLENSVVLDTSVLIDGRLLDVVKTGFFDNTFVVLPAVLNELHLVSDNEDKLKRERGRRGLDTVKRLKGLARVLTPNIKLSGEGVDNKLVDFSRTNKIKLMTQDYNLKKLAEAQGIKVLSLNELVEAVKISVLPGERFTLEISHTGKEKQQGVGYLPDGTMVVVEGAREYVGQSLLVKAVKLIQSPAGKIIFCQLEKQ